MSSKYIGIMTILLALSASGFGSAFAGGAASVPEGGTPAEAASPPPKSPIRLSTIDFQDTAEGAGKLTIAGVALPGSEVYLFLDDEPFATVMPDDGGKWSIESGMKLENGRHTLRADQYDQATDMLAARAIVTIQRSKPGAGEAPSESPAPKATSP
ncbi:MAG: hypothetical protein H7X78_03585 [Methyloceanibacter sp.]|nr:hypothetical protein [Methyloceanibacter sp.]